MTVANILKSKGSSHVETIGPGATALEAARRLAEKRFGSLVVADGDGTPIGILSERDIVREVGRRGAAVLAEPVEKLMTKKIVSCTRAEKAVSVLATMTEQRFRHMPVVENGRLVGLITIGDVVKYRLEELAMEKDALEGMIMGF
ncbi:CBS domain-containing protein [Rhodovulum sp. 12E13]|uniref:CBS domain-containing protein n=1 Tax=Rhodovulum sp. 12E13 TaxID=2203891 RepID=UPI000E19FA6E|nr:CBS domain-containing protein [Rhodovulum sp. 12E13]RDC73475.1 CBS domain-containing protein [Rhodovulum sp. 12E13]